MEDKYNKTLENVLILADDEVIEICTKKSYNDDCSVKLSRDDLCRKDLRELVTNNKKCPHFGLKIKEKRLHKKIRHYTMKIVNFNTVLLHDNFRNEYYVVFYRSGLSFNANIAHFYFTGLAKPTRKQKKNRRRAIKRKQSVSFKNYLRRSIKQHFHKYLDGKHSLISVHAIFTVDNPQKSKVFITRDIIKHSDIAKFIKMVETFDTTLKDSKVNKKVEDYLQTKLKVPLNNVLVIAHVNQSRNNLFIQRSDKLVNSLHRKNMKDARLISLNMLNLRLDHVRLNGAGSTSVRRFMNLIDEFVTNNIQGENIENKLEKQLNSCKTFIACLDAFDSSKLSDITKRPRSLKLKDVCLEEPKVETKKEVGDTGDSKVLMSEECEEKVQGIMDKIDTLQKRIRKHVRTSPSPENTDVIQRKKTRSSLFETADVIPNNSQLLNQVEMDSKRDTLPKSIFCKPEKLRNDVRANLNKLEESLKQDFTQNRLRIQGLLQQVETSPEQQDKEPEIAKVSETPSVQISNAPDEGTLKKIAVIEKLLKDKLKYQGSEFEKLLKALQARTNTEDFKKVVLQLKVLCESRRAQTTPKVEKPTPKVEPEEPAPKPEASNNNIPESHSLKSLFAAKNVKLRSKPKQKRRKPENETKSAVSVSKALPSEPSVLKLENFIDQILNITKNYFSNGNREGSKSQEDVLATDITENSKTKNPTIITIKKYTELGETKSEISTNTVDSYIRSAKMAESGVQTERSRRRKLLGKNTQTEMDANEAKEKKANAMETQTDISIHKHAQIKFSGMSMQLSKNVTITNVRKNVINVRNICEETSEAVKRLLEREAAYHEDNVAMGRISGELQRGTNKAEILGQIKNTLENVIDRFKKSTLLISKTRNFSDITENLKKIMVPTELPGDALKVRTDKSTVTSEHATNRKEDKSSNLAMSLKLLKNLSEVTKTIRKNPREAAKKLHGIRNELMQYRKNKLYSSKPSSNLYLPKKSSTLTAKPSKDRTRRSNTLFPKDVPLNMYGYPASSSDLKPDLNELNRIFTPKTRSICNTELSILKHRDRYADHIANHMTSKQSIHSKYCFDLKTFRTKSSQMKSHKCQMYIAKTYKKSYANSLSQTACTTTNIPQIQTAIENPLVPKIVRPVRWKHPIPESPQLSNLSLNDVKPFNSEYPRKDHVSTSTHNYLERLLDTPDAQVPTIKCSDKDCAKCSPPVEVSVCGKSPKETTDFIVNKGTAHFKTEIRKNAEPQVDRPSPEAGTPTATFDFGRFMMDPLNGGGKDSGLRPKVMFTVCPVNILQNNRPPESPKSATPLNKRLYEVKTSQNKMQKSIQQAIIQNQEKFQAMQRILALSKPQERKMAHPSSSRNSAGSPKIKSSHAKKISKLSEATTSKSRSLPMAPQLSNTVQTAVATYKTVKQVQPHPKLRQLQQHQIPLKPIVNPPAVSKPNVEPNTTASFNKKYSEVSLSSLQTIIAKDEKTSTKTLGTNQKNSKRSQEDIQKYIALVEQKFLKTFSLDEHEKEGAYKNLVDEIQGMLNVLNSKDKTDKKMKIKKSLEKLTKETEQPTTNTTPVKKNAKTEIAPNALELVKYAKTLESVGKSLKDFQNNYEENYKISEAATEKLLNWKTTTAAATTATAKSTHDDLSKSEDFSKSESSKTSTQYTLSEKERIIEEKLIEIPTDPKTNNEVVVLMDPNSAAKINQIPNEETSSGTIKKKNSDFSRPTLLSPSIISTDSLNESDDVINYSISIKSSSKPKSKQNSRSSKRKAKIQESPNSTDTSLVPISNDNDNTEDSYLTITEYSESGSSHSDVKITPLVEFSVEMNLCVHLHYSYKCQPTVASIIPHIYHKITYIDKIEAKPITQAYKQKYSTNSSAVISYDYPISSTLNFSSISEDSVHIEQEFFKNYSDKLFSESINTILSKNSEFSLRNILGDTSSERLVPKTSSHYYDYVDLLSNISRIFIEPEVTQFYHPKFVSHFSEPERTVRTYYITIISCRVEFHYVEYNPSYCNLLESSKSNLNQSKSLVSLQNTRNSNPWTQNSLSHLSGTQNTVSEISDLTLNQISSTSLSTGDIFGEITEKKNLPQPVIPQNNATSTPFHSIKSSITKFEYLNENVEIQTITLPSAENIAQIENVNILIQNVDEHSKPGKKPSLEELYVENVCFASKTSSTYFNNEISFNDDELQLIKANDAKDEIVENVDVSGDFKRLSNKLAQQSNELGQILINNQYKQRRLPKIVSVKNFNTHPFLSNTFLGHRHDRNYDLKLTISPKYLATSFPSPTCMQILPLLKNRIGSMSHSLTMKIELNHSKSSRCSLKNVSFKKPKRSIIVYNKVSQRNETLSKKLSAVKVQSTEEVLIDNPTESHKMALILLYVSLFSFIFVCMTLNYKCE